MGDTLIMSRKERQRKVILEQRLNGQISHTVAAKRLSISTRHLSRVLCRYREEGDEGLVHKSRGGRPNCAKPDEFKQQVIETYKENYLDFGPTLASEKLEEENSLIVNTETLRLWLKDALLWLPNRRRKAHRSRRERKAQLVHPPWKHTRPEGFWRLAEGEFRTVFSDISSGTANEIHRGQRTTRTPPSFEEVWACFQPQLPSFLG